MQPIPGGTLPAFALGRTPVPQELWAEYAALGGGKMPQAPAWGWREKHPVVNVSWDDCQRFCQWASRVSGLSVTLPTAAQFGYAACGGGKNVRFPWGDGFDGSKLVYVKNSSSQTAAVDRLDRRYEVRFRNGSTLLDMSGNVWQWCSDRDSGGKIVLRGGSWSDYLNEHFRCAGSVGFAPHLHTINIGFRLAS